MTDLDKEVTISIHKRGFTFPTFNKDVKKGKHATIVIRPEGLHITKQSPEAFFNGIISEAVYLGSTMEYEITVKGRSEPIVAISYNPVLEGFYKVGDEVGVTFDPVSAHVIS